VLITKVKRVSRMSDFKDFFNSIETKNPKFANNLLPSKSDSETAVSMNINNEFARLRSTASLSSFSDSDTEKFSKKVSRLVHSDDFLNDLRNGNLITCAFTN